jgi:Flp pilus assembly protein TadD
MLIWPDLRRKLAEHDHGPTEEPSCRQMTRRKPINDAPRQRTAVSPAVAKTGLTHRPWLLAVVLAVVTFVAYQPVWHAGYIWDDDLHVTQNVNLRSFPGLYRIWFEPLADQQYYPLQLTSFWIEYHLWGVRPFGYHAVNILLHALNALLLWMVLQRLEVPGAWLAAAVFAVHPVQVESVAWISEIKNLLSTTFYLGTLLAFFRFRPLSGEAQAGSSPWRFYSLAIALFLCALLSKTVACSLPAVLVLLIWWKRGWVARRDVMVLSPMFLLGITLGLMTAWLEKHHVNASGAEWSLSFLQRCLLAGRVLWFYAGKLFWPHPLMFIYPHWDIDAGAWWQYLLPVAALAVVVALWSLRCRIGKGPLVAALCFGCTLFPALGFFDVYPFRFSYVADHFQYLACTGLIALAVCTGTAICERAGQQGRDWGTLTAAIVLLLLGVSTWRQGHSYRDAETLWRDTLTKNPQCWMAHNNLGAILMLSGRAPEAIAQYEQALRLKSDYTEAHINLGNAFFYEGQVEDAIGQYAQALRLKPSSAEAHTRLGIALDRTGKLSEAAGHYEQALRIKPDYPQALNNLAWFLATRPPTEGGDAVRAVALAERACQLTDNRAAVSLDTLAVAYAATGRFDAAVATAQKAVELARTVSQPTLAREIEGRLEMYRTGRAYSQSTGVTTPSNR